MRYNFCHYTTEELSMIKKEVDKKLDCLDLDFEIFQNLMEYSYCISQELQKRNYDEYLEDYISECYIS